MKTIKQFTVLSILCMSFIFVACKKDDNKDDTNNNTACSAGANFCMQYGNIQKSGNATYMDLTSSTPNRHRVYFKSGNEQMEIDLYTTGTGTLDVSNSEAALEYFDGSAATSAISGTVNITQFAPSGAGISGTFEVKMGDGTNVTNGNFINIK